MLLCFPFPPLLQQWLYNWFFFFRTGGSCYSSNNNLSWLLVPLQQSCGEKPEEKCRALWFMRAIWPVLIRGIYEWDANLGNGLWALLCGGSTIVAFGGDGIDVCADWKTNKTSSLNSDAKKEKKNQLCPHTHPTPRKCFFFPFLILISHISLLLYDSSHYVFLERWIQHSPIPSFSICSHSFRLLPPFRGRLKFSRSGRDQCQLSGPIRCRDTQVRVSSLCLSPSLLVEEDRCGGKPHGGYLCPRVVLQRSAFVETPKILPACISPIRRLPPADSDNI